MPLTHQNAGAEQIYAV